MSNYDFFKPTASVIAKPKNSIVMSKTDFEIHKRKTLLSTGLALFRTKGEVTECGMEVIYQGEKDIILIT